jgi:hypothetical protein
MVFPPPLHLVFGVAFNLIKGDCRQGFPVNDIGCLLFYFIPLFVDDAPI